MTRHLRRAVFLLLLALGALGLLGTASGSMPGAPAWVWLAVLALAVGGQVSGDHYSARQRLVRRTERRLVTLADDARRLRADLDAQRAVVEEQDKALKHVHGVAATLAKDVAPIKEQMDSINNAGGLRALVRPR